MMFRFRVVIATAAISFSALATSAAVATSLDFTGDFDTSNFTFETTADGSIDFSSAPDSFTLIGTDSAGTNTQSGSLSFELAAGETFGFGIDSADGTFREASVAISNVEANTVSNAEATPEPMTVIGSLLGGAALLGARRKMARQVQ